MKARVLVTQPQHQSKDPLTISEHMGVTSTTTKAGWSRRLKGRQVIVLGMGSQGPGEEDTEAL